MSFQKLFKKAEEYSGTGQPFPVVQADTSAFDSLPTEEDGEQVGKNSRIKLSDPEMDKMRSIIRRVVIDVKDRDSVVGRVSDANVLHSHPSDWQTNELLQQQLRGILPDISWEKEIAHVMCNETSDEDQSEVESDDEEKQRPSGKGSVLKTTEKFFLGGAARKVVVESNNKNRTSSSHSTMQMLRPQQRVTFDVAPYSCFETDFLDAGCLDDPLDVLIPNAPHSQRFLHQDMMDMEITDGQPGTASAGVDGATSNAGAGGEQQRINTNRLNLGSASSVRLGSGSQSGQTVQPEVEETVMSKSERDKQRKLEKAQRIKGVDIGFDTAASFMFTGLVVTVRSPFLSINSCEYFMLPFSEALLRGSNSSVDCVCNRLSSISFALECCEDSNSLRRMRNCSISCLYARSSVLSSNASFTFDDILIIFALVANLSVLPVSSTHCAVGETVHIIPIRALPSSADSKMRVSLLSR